MAAFHGSLRIEWLVSCRFNPNALFRAIWKALRACRRDARPILKTRAPNSGPASKVKCFSEHAPTCCSRGEARRGPNLKARCQLASSDLCGGQVLSGIDAVFMHGELLRPLWLMKESHARHRNCRLRARCALHTAGGCCGTAGGLQFSDIEQGQSA